MSQTAPAYGPGPQAAVATLPPPDVRAQQVAMVVPSGTAPATPIADRPGETPRRLRRLSVAMIALGVVFAVVGALCFAAVAYALNQAEANTAQLIRVQKIQTNLLSADATATNAFLVGGLEPTAQRAAYDQAIAATSTLIAEAAEAQPADSNALAALNTQVVDYASAIEQARANNRQGFPVGAQYLRNASAGLRGDGLPILDSLVRTNADRASTAMTSPAVYVFIGLGLLALVALILTQYWVAKRFKRTLNTGLVTATVLVLVAVIGGTIALTRTASAVSDIRRTSFDQVNAAAAVRINANNAKSNESLTLIARGSGAAFETAWKDSAATVTTNLDRLDQRDLGAQWQAYAATHAAIRKLDDGGDWDAAVARATGTADNSANTTFAGFDKSAASALDSASSATATGLAAAQPGLVVGALLMLLAGIGAAVLSRWGLAQRLKEYR